MKSTTPKAHKNEWCTPAVYVEAAREVMGRIDLDPASNDRAQKIVQASTYYTAETDGLAYEWRGRVWLNPPYSNGMIGRFVEKLLTEFQAGRIDEAVVLTHNNTDTAWWHDLARHATAICFTRGRIAFDDGTGRSNPTQGQTFFYFDTASYPHVFGAVFSWFGFVTEQNRPILGELGSDGQFERL